MSILSLRVLHLSLRGTKQSVSLWAKDFKHPFVNSTDCFVPRNDRKSKRNDLKGILFHLSFYKF